MAWTMQQFLTRYNIRLLPFSDATIDPGYVLHKKTLNQLVYLAYWMEGDNATWPTRPTQATWPKGIEWEKSLEGKASLKIPGIVSIGGGLDKASSGTFSITGLSAVRLTSPKYDPLPLRERLEIWRPTNPSRYRKIHDQLFVQETWFCTGYTLTLSGQSGANFEASTSGKVEVAGDASLKWTSKSTVEVAGNPAVPFGVQTWMI